MNLSKPQTASSLPRIIKRKTTGLHKNNPHQGAYSFPRLTEALPELKPKVIRNPQGMATIRFDDPEAVLLLNRALLASYYQIKAWSLPKGALCPPLPGRADYVHRLADLLYQDQPALKHQRISVLDIGTGANGVYPLIGSVAYDWYFKASDINAASIKNVANILAANPTVRDHISLAVQTRPNHMFHGVIQPEERYHLTLCNPPFHRSLDEAMQGSTRKVNNLKANQQKRAGKTGSGNTQSVAGPQASATLNFGGQKAELWCPGGEIGFIRKLANESKEYKNQVMWFSTLVSKKDNVRPLRKQLEKLGVNTIQIIQMQHGQKISRFVAWTYQSDAQRRRWSNV